MALRGRKPSRRTLYAIVTGANDYRVDAFNVPMSVSEVVQNIVHSVKTLYGIGARDIMVLNLPDLGLVPGEAGHSAESTALSLAHNEALKAALTDLQAQLPRLHLMQPDLIRAFELLPAGMEKTIPALEVFFAGDPTLPPGFPISACLFIDPATCRNSPVPFNIDLNFAFWDIVHPTTEAHRYLAQYLYSVLSGS